MLQLKCDNMKNKGFTLVELIITITLIAIISVSIGVSVTNMLSRQEEGQAEEFAKTISDAACVYVELYPDEFEEKTEATVDINKLLEAGLLSRELTNPLNDESITLSKYTDSNVTITWDNGLKTCSYEIPD